MFLSFRGWFCRFPAVHLPGIPSWPSMFNAYGGRRSANKKAKHGILGTKSKWSKWSRSKSFSKWLVGTFGSWFKAIKIISRCVCICVFLISFSVYTLLHGVISTGAPQPKSALGFPSNLATVATRRLSFGRKWSLSINLHLFTGIIGFPWSLYMLIQLLPWFLPTCSLHLALPETNIALENQWLEDSITFKLLGPGPAYFQVLLLFVYCHWSNYFLYWRKYYYMKEISRLVLQIPCEARCLGTFSTHLQKGLEHN